MTGTSLLDLTDELLLKIAEIAEEWYCTIVYEGPSSRSCSCGRCPPKQPQPTMDCLRARDRFVRKSDAPDRPTFSTSCTLNALASTCKRLSRIVTPLLYSFVILLGRASVQHLARTLTDHPDHAMRIGQLSFVGEGDCGDVFSFFTETPILYVLAKCLWVEEVYFYDIGDSSRTSSCTSLCWTMAFDLLSSTKLSSCMRNIPFLTSPPASGLPKLEWLSFTRCGQLDFTHSLPLLGLSDLVLDDFGSIKHTQARQMPNLKSLFLFQSEGVLRLDGLPIHSFHHLTFLALYGNPDPLSIVVALQNCPNLKIFRTELDDTSFKYDSPPSVSFRHLPQVAPPATFQIFSIILEFQNWLDNRVPVLNGLNELIRLSGASKVLVELYLRDRRTWNIDPQESGIIRRVKETLTNAQNLIVKILEMDIKVVYEELEWTDLDYDEEEDEEEEGKEVEAEEGEGGDETEGNAEVSEVEVLDAEMMDVKPEVDKSLFKYFKVVGRTVNGQYLTVNE